MAIRICDDNLVYCIKKQEVTQKRLEEIFKSNRSVNVCIIDEAEKYQGFLTYYTLKEFDLIENAIVKEFAYLNENVWKGAYNYLKRNRTKYVPIIDMEGKLVFFAYNDDRSNKTLRYIKELRKCKEALEDIVEWVAWEGLNIIGLNEITYEVYLLLKDINKQVALSGDGWRNIVSEVEDELCESYKCLIAEEKMLDICKYDFIFDWHCKCRLNARMCENSLGKNIILRGKEVIVDCTLKNVEKICNELLLLGANIRGLHIEEINESKIWGYPVLQEQECLELCKTNKMLISEQESNLFEKLYYEGQELGRDIILFSHIKNIEEVKINVLLRNKRIGLVGNKCLCQILFKYFIDVLKLKQENIFFLNILSEDIENTNLKKIEKDIEDTRIFDEEIQYFIVEKSTMKDFGIGSRVSVIRKSMQEAGLKNISDYYLSNFEYLNEVIERKKLNKTYNKEKKSVDIVRIVLGCTKSYSGNYFISELLDGHPDAMSIPHSFFHNLLWYYSLYLLEMSEVDDMAGNLKKIYLEDLEEIGQENEFFSLFSDWDKFSRGLLEVLHTKKEISVYTIFVSVHVAYYYMNHGYYHTKREPWIYWEPHRIREKSKLLYIYDWFERYFEHFVLLKIVRDPIRSLGSSIRDMMNCNLMRHLSIWQWATEEIYLDRFEKNICVVRFEDIKLYPERVMRFLCDRIGIIWSESMMHTTINGESTTYDNGAYVVKDFDLKPVYNKYTEYFTEFDMSRLELLFYNIRNAYGYDTGKAPVVSSYQLCQWFEIPFKFEDPSIYNKQEWEGHTLRNVIRSNCYSILHKYFEIDADLSIHKFYKYNKF